MIKRLLFIIYVVLLLASAAYSQGYIQSHGSGGGSGDVTGPASSTTGNIPKFADTSGKVLSDGGALSQDVSTASHYLYKNSSGSISDAPDTLSKVIASGTVTLGTSIISPGAKASTVSAAATSALSTDSLLWGFSKDITGITGFIPSSNGMLTIISYCSTNSVNFIVANNTATSYTPSEGVILNWMVVRKVS